MNKVIILIVFALIFNACKSKNLLSDGSSAMEKPSEEVVLDGDLSDINLLEEEFGFFDSNDASRFDDMPYFVILGSFRSSENATNFLQSLKNIDFDPVILLTETGLHRVSVASYQELNPARQKVSEIRNAYPQYQDAWLLIRK